VNSEPWPPPSSLLEPPPALKQLFMHAIVGECGGGGGDAVRTPQSTQSVLNVHKRMEVSKHGLEHMFGGGYGAGCAAGDRGGGDGMETRGPLVTEQYSTFLVSYRKN
jgi:hypothetical protein